MAYTNSPLVDYVRLSPNNSGLRNHKIDCIAIHCVVGQCSVETIGRIFAPTSKAASSNYGIGYDGKVGMYVEEKNRSWCTSSSIVDNRAITIEVASDATEPYTVKPAAFEKLIVLCADICKRNNIKKLLWKADPSLLTFDEDGFVATVQADQQNMIVHRWTTHGRKSCPGTYLYNKHYEIAERVNKLLDAEDNTPSNPTETSISVGDIVKISQNAYYYNRTTPVPSWVTAKLWYVDSVAGSRCVIGKSVDGRNNIQSAIDIKYLTKVDENGNEIKVPEKPVTPPVIVDTNFKVGDAVNIKSGAYYYNGVTPVPAWVAAKSWYLSSVSTTNDRCVLGTSVDGKNNIQSAISSKYLVKVKAENNVKQNTEIVHVVRHGDTMYSIAKAYNVNINTLRAYNLLTSNLLFTGQKIRIPK